MGIFAIYIFRMVNIHPAGPLVSEAEFPGARDFTLDGEIELIGVTVDKVFRQRKCEGQNRKRESCGQIVLIRKKRTGSKRIETLLIGQVKHARKGVQRALEYRRAVQVRGRVKAVAANWSDQPASGSCAADREQLHRAATVGSHGVECSSQQRMVVENPVAGADNGLAIAGGIPGQSDTGGDVVVIARNAFHNTESLLRGGI